MWVTLGITWTNLIGWLIGWLVTWWRRRAAPRVGSCGRTRRRAAGRTAARCRPRRISPRERSWGCRRAPERQQRSADERDGRDVWKLMLNFETNIKSFSLILRLLFLSHRHQHKVSQSTNYWSTRGRRSLNAPWRSSSCWGSRCRWCSARRGSGCPRVWRNLPRFLGNTPPWPEETHRQQFALDRGLQHLLIDQLFDP